MAAAVPSPPQDLESATNEQLKLLLVQALEQVTALRAEIVVLRDEVARLKGLKGPPKIPPSKPSGMEKATEPKPASPGRRRRGPWRRDPKRAIVDEQVLQVPVPPGSRFKGYEDYVVQDLVIQARVTRYRRERWVTPDGATVIAPLPAGITGHFGAELRRFVLAQYYQGQVPMPRLTAQLHGFGIEISKREVVRLLSQGHQRFQDEARDVLRAGLAEADWITVDDTGARHRVSNGFCTQVGNAHFTWFGTTGSKSRLNFLELLRAGHSDYVVDDEALAYMKQRALAGPVIAQLQAHPDKHFADREAWQAHLERLGIDRLTVKPDPVCMATEGALWGSIRAHGLLNDTVIVSDGAGQFDLGTHALCWAHAERLVHKLVPVTDGQRAAQSLVRGLIWELYRELKAYRLAPGPERQAELTDRFDKLCQRDTGWVTLDRLLSRMHAQKPDLLRVLTRPAIPLHTNGSENDIRCHVTKRKISGGTRSDLGRDCRDSFLGLLKTCAKHAISFWDYLGSRLAVPGASVVPPLPDLITHRCASA